MISCDSKVAKNVGSHYALTAVNGHRVFKVAFASLKRRMFENISRLRDKELFAVLKADGKFLKFTH